MTQIAEVLRAAFIVGLTLSITISPSAGQTPEVSGAGNLTVRVVDGLSGSAIEAAVISLTPSSPTINVSAGVSLSARSQDNGNAILKDIPPGTYQLSCKATGYLATDDVTLGNRTTNVRSGETVDITLRLSRATSIEGLVVNDSDQGVSSATVSALRQAGTHGRERLEVSARAVTDKAGRFLLDNLRPGPYVVMAQPSFSSSSTLAETAKQNIEQLDYATTYYPAALNASEASQVDLRSREADPRIKIILKRAKPHTVSGIITAELASEVNKGAALLLLEESIPFTPATARTVPLSPDRTFKIGGVFTGTYILQLRRAESKDVSTPVSNSINRILVSRQIHVASSDVTDLVLGTSSAVPVSGRLTGDIAGVPDLSTTRVLIESLEPMFPVGLSLEMKVSKDGMFSVPPLDVGRYVVHVKPPKEMYVSRIMFGQREISDCVLDLTRNAGPELDIQLQKGGAAVYGGLQSSASTGRLVVLMDDATFMTGTTDGHVSTIKEGRFVIDGLAPGSYSAVALQVYSPEIFRNTQFLEVLQPYLKHITLRKQDNLPIELTLLTEEQLRQLMLEAGLISF